MGRTRKDTFVRYRKEYVRIKILWHYKVTVLQGPIVDGSNESQK